MRRAVGLAIGGSAAAPPCQRRRAMSYRRWSWRSWILGSRPAGLGGLRRRRGQRPTAHQSRGHRSPRKRGTAGTPTCGSGSPQPGTRDHRQAGRPARPRPRRRKARPPPYCQPLRARPSDTVRGRAFGERASTQENQVDVVRGPGRLESESLSSSAEEVGLARPRPQPWLNLGVTVAYYIRLGPDAITNVAGDELARHLRWRFNKARHRGPARPFAGQRSHCVPPRRRHHRDLVGWSVDTEIDRVAGLVAGPRTIDLEEAPYAGAPCGSPTPGSVGRGGHIWYDRAAHRARNTDGATRARSSCATARAAFRIELTKPSRPAATSLRRASAATRRGAGLRGTDAPLQAFGSRQPPPSARGRARRSGEFYENGFRLDIDISQVVVERLTSVRSAGKRRISFGLTVRL